LDYRDPFETLPPVSLKPANGDQAATKQRERLRGHIQQLQKASQQKHEGGESNSTHTRGTDTSRTGTGMNV
jgi:hypothetical protein